ncbi:MAG: HD domain-containing protein [Desulfosarcina sp.]|nr:HD domain-containing protein [Desulfosarcina sp.]MBC2743031.1 HD domain-containing protein [Desulfosarcina sp.]MBC2765941.1 HD domain-containing protein [Desulfosarcina sp.]
MISSYHQYFKAFANVSKAIHSGMETEEILGRIVSSITEAMAATGCIYWIINREAECIEHKVSSGFDYRSLSGVDLPTLQTIFPADADSMVFIEDARYDERLPDLERLGKRRVVTVIGMPVEIVPPYAGVLAVYFGMKRELNSTEVEFLTALGEQGAIALHKALRYDECLLDTFRQTVEGLAMALEAKHPETHGHSLNVARLARITAQKMELPEKQARALYQAGLLHDIGKIGTGREILGRLGRLSAKEMDLIRMHPVVGANILRPLVFLEHLIPMVRHHHEHVDGSGYPDGLTGAAIPLGARILAVCDAFETMIAGRAGIRPISLEDAAIQLKTGSGTRFDPQVATALVAAVRENPAILSCHMGSEEELERFEMLFRDNRMPESTAPWCTASF